MFCNPSREQLEGTVYLETRYTLQDANPLGMVFLNLIRVTTSKATKTRSASSVFFEAFFCETKKATEAGHRLYVSFLRPNLGKHDLTAS
jgi:hypothetical protein